MNWLGNKFVQSIILGAARTMLAGAVPTLIAAGVLQPTQGNDFIGAGCFFVAMALSILDKKVVDTKLGVAAATGAVPVSVNVLKSVAAQTTMAPIPNP